MPARPARIRSARVPWGTSSSTTPPSATFFSNGVCTRGEGAAGGDELNGFRPQAAVIAHYGQVAQPPAAHGGDEVAGALPRPAEATDEQDGAVRDVGHRLIE